MRDFHLSRYLDKNRNAKEEFARERLPGAVFFDIEAISDKTSSLPHMLPPGELVYTTISMPRSTASHVLIGCGAFVWLFVWLVAQFEEAMKALGLSNDDTLVVYGGKNCFR